MLTFLCVCFWVKDTIFVRVYESRIDILRAAIIGAEGTPYHDGLFFFDVCFPSDYPNSPPLVLYRSGGLRINPNLYGCGYNFEELVVGHFCERVGDILMACKAYMEGVQVGCFVRVGVQDVVDEGGDDKCSAHFKKKYWSEADEFLTLSGNKISLLTLAPPPPLPPPPNDKFSPLALAPPPPLPPPPNDNFSPLAYNIAHSA
ncbi:putative ubiquitin-conjugating enzyme E2 39 [Rutidosis leptorrhynchoides]|uniref:putative ubiquitin-conjugating enzyme E2 39 n=1 Tax=Rutidosis leptorrhynchoides TaxID=125765 RepID=UPI003A99FF1D